MGTVLRISCEIRVGILEYELIGYCVGYCTRISTYL